MHAGSPYAVRDFYAINPDYGTADDLKRLVAAAHERGLRVLIDMVLNHTAWDSVLMKTPAFYVRDSQGRVQPSNENWTDVAKLDYANPALRAYMIEMLRYWLREFDLDGFRCDVAGLVPTDFWEEARAALEHHRVRRTGARGAASRLLADRGAASGARALLSPDDRAPSRP